MRADRGADVQTKGGTDLNVLVSHYELVYLEWRDSYGVSAEWRETEAAEPHAHRCFSVGWILKETDEAIILAPHLSPANDLIHAEEQSCGDMVIPKSAVVHRRHIA